MLEGNLFKIRPDKLEKWESWCQSLNTTLRKEAEGTIREEGMIQEAFLLFKIGDDYFTAGIGEGLRLPASGKEINRKHREISRECLEKIGKISCLYNFNLKNI